VAKRKRSRPSRQSRSSRQPPSARPILVLGRSREAMPLICRQLDFYRRRYAKGDHTALLRALDLWLSCCLGPPKWIADGFYAAWTKWLKYEAPTLDAAFDIQRRSLGKHVNTQRERERLRSYIVHRVERLRQRGMALDVRLFDEVGTEIDRSASFVSGVYYENASAGLRLILRKMKIS
jgi:hypothetical protein